MTNNFRCPTCGQDFDTGGGMIGHICFLSETHQAQANTPNNVVYDNMPGHDLNQSRTMANGTYNVPRVNEKIVEMQRIDELEAQEKINKGLIDHYKSLYEKQVDFTREARRQIKQLVEFLQDAENNAVDQPYRISRRAKKLLDEIGEK